MTTRFWIDDNEIIEKIGKLDDSGTFKYYGAFCERERRKGWHFETKNEAIHDALKGIEDELCELEQQKNELMGMLE